MAYQAAAGGKYNCKNSGEPCNNRGICHSKGFCICRQEYYGEVCEFTFDLKGTISGISIFLMVLLWAELETEDREVIQE